MTADLRAALEGARGETDRTADRWISDEVLAIFERHVRAYLKEKAGESLPTAIEAAGIEAEALFITQGGVSPEEHLSIFERRLSPLFAALRERAEEAEAKIAAIRTASEPMAKLLEQFDADEGFASKGARVLPDECDFADAIRAALREIALAPPAEGEGEERA